ncbi:MAG: chemotaxis protein MotB, partial [Romboutsia sp.]|nr:chemotaxis protein MotB [Romboutsia sp.]
MARRKKKGDEIKTDGWMDTFADTMTLLLTFFILLYSISAVD